MHSRVSTPAVTAEHDELGVPTFLDEPAGWHVADQSAVLCRELAPESPACRGQLRSSEHRNPARPERRAGDVRSSINRAAQIRDT